MSVNILSTSSLYGVSITGGVGAQGLATSLGVSTGDYQSVKVGMNAAQLQRGGSNVFVGQSVAEMSSDGNNNVAVGYRAAANLAGDANAVFGSVSASTLGGQGSSNVVFGCGADVTASNVSGAVAVGSRAAASGSSTSVGSLATASGFRSVALGSSTRASGIGSFTLANRLRGYYSGSGSGGSSYAVQVDADVLKLSNGGMLGFCGRTLNSASSAASLDPMDQVPAWRMGLEGDDLVLRSVRGAVVRFVDDYRSSVLNFTGSHLVQWARPEALIHALCTVPKAVRDANIDAKRHPLAYTLVQVVENENENDIALSDVEADDALPRVAVWLSSFNHDDSTINRDAASVFGAIAARQGDGEARRIGHLDFGNGSSSRGIFVHAAGDGKVWVNLQPRPGSLSLASYPVGTLLTADPDVPGLACPQVTPIVLSTTVAKTTQTMTMHVDTRFQLISCTYRM